MKRTRTLPSNLRLFGQCLLLGFLLTPVMAVGQIDAELLRQAEAGVAWAQFYIGVVYENGLGVPQDDANAVKWFRLAAEQGEAGAQCTAGREGLPDPRGSRGQPIPQPTYGSPIPILPSHHRYEWAGATCSLRAVRRGVGKRVRDGKGGRDRCFPFNKWCLSAEQRFIQRAFIQAS